MWIMGSGKMKYFDIEDKNENLAIIELCLNAIAENSAERKSTSKKNVVSSKIDFFLLHYLTTYLTAYLSIYYKEYSKIVI